MELVQQKSGNGVRWVVVKSGMEIARESRGDSGDGKSPLLAQSACEKWGTHGVDESRRGTFGDRIQCADESGHRNIGGGIVIPWLDACVDPAEKWWVRLRGNPKRSGEISQAAFLLKAETMGFDVALPWGDNQKFDFLLRHRSGQAIRVQVKGTGRLHRRGYEVQPVHATRRGGKERYTKRDIDVIAAHVQPEDAWYLIPIEKVGSAKSLRLYPGVESKAGNRNATRRKSRSARRSLGRRRTRLWEQWRDRWDVLDAR